MFVEELLGVLWYKGMMSSGQEHKGPLALLPASGIIVYWGSPGDVGSASRADAIHLLQSAPACCRTMDLRHAILSFWETVGLQGNDEAFQNTGQSWDQWVVWHCVGCWSGHGHHSFLISLAERGRSSCAVMPHQYWWDMEGRVRSSTQAWPSPASCHLTQLFECSPCGVDSAQRALSEFILIIF